MSDSVRNFYDQLSEDYHLIFEDWDVSVKRQGKILDQIIGNHLNQPRHNMKVFDCCFNVVISCDNSLPHLLDHDDLKLTVKNIWDKLEYGGLFLASIRDYDQLLQEKPHATTPAVYDDQNGKRIVFQVWDWELNENVYTLNHFVVREDGDNWRTDCRSTRYWALLRSELSLILDEMGFFDINWSLPEETGYYQPIVTAYKR